MSYIRSRSFNPEVICLSSTTVNLTRGSLCNLKTKHIFCFCFTISKVETNGHKNLLNKHFLVLYWPLDKHSLIPTSVLLYRGSCIVMSLFSGCFDLMQVNWQCCAHFLTRRVYLSRVKNKLSFHGGLSCRVHLWATAFVSLAGSSARVTAATALPLLKLQQTSVKQCKSQ